MIRCSEPQHDQPAAASESAGQALPGGAQDTPGDGFTIQPFRADEWSLARTMLLAGYPNTPATLWDDGFKRLAAVPPLPDSPPLGVLLCLNTQPVGVALMFPSQRQGGTHPVPRVNASSWAITPKARGRALWMARHSMNHPGTVYTALTPISSAARMLQRIGFRAISHQSIVGFTPRLRRLAAKGKRVLSGVDALAALRDHPLAQALEDHHRLDCLVTALDTGSALHPMVWRATRRLRLFRSADLLYAPTQALVAQHAGVLAQQLWRLGFPMMVFEAQEDLVPEFACTRLFQRRFARGPYNELGVDHLYSELVYLHR